MEGTSRSSGSNQVNSHTRPNRTDARRHSMRLLYHCVCVLCVSVYVRTCVCCVLCCVLCRVLKCVHVCAACTSMCVCVYASACVWRVFMACDLLYKCVACAVRVKRCEGGRHARGWHRGLLRVHNQGRRRPSVRVRVYIVRVVRMQYLYLLFRLEVAWSFSGQ